jgi:hypothetical protein
MLRSSEKIGGKLMTKHSKFIQIATASETVRSGQVKPVLFALDEEGNVWEYDYGHPRVNKRPQWVSLPTDRK